MSSDTSSSSPAPAPPDDPLFEGMFGPYRITAADRREVLAYRLALATVAIAQLAAVLQWRWLGPEGLSPWLLLMALSLGLALRWIHIYLRPLHLALQLLWLVGCLGGLVLTVRVGPAALVPTLVQHPLAVLAVGPAFAALTGVGFKEFFCFRRPEAIGVTLLLPLLLLGHLSGLLSLPLCAGLLALETALLLVLTLRKFPMEAAADIGDKSVFAHLEAQREAQGAAGHGA